MSEQSRDPNEDASHRQEDDGERRWKSLPPIVTHAPEGLAGNAPRNLIKRSEWVAIGALGASVIAVFAVAEGVNRVNRCTPEPNPTSTAIVRADTNCNSSSYHGGSYYSGSHATEEAHFGGFGKAGSAHVGGFGE